MRDILSGLPVDLESDGLRDTPRRYVKALMELTKGYYDDPAEILARTFAEPYDEMVVVAGIEFVSLCEHHILPFTGHVTVGYLPKGKVVGLSKIPRLVHCFARRLQIQERLTVQIAEAIEKHVEPIGVGVIVTAQHSCMSLRGVRSSGQMVTSSMTGAFRNAAREEFMSIHEAQQKNAR